jgi:hypothetical protein
VPISLQQQQQQQVAAGPVNLQQLAAWMELQLATLEKVQGVLLAQAGWSPAGGPGAAPQL